MSGVDGRAHIDARLGAIPTVKVGFDGEPSVILAKFARLILHELVLQISKPAFQASALGLENFAPVFEFPPFATFALLGMGTPYSS